MHRCPNGATSELRDADSRALPRRALAKARRDAICRALVAYGFLLVRGGADYST